MFQKKTAISPALTAHLLIPFKLHVVQYIPRLEQLLKLLPSSSNSRYYLYNVYNVYNVHSFVPMAWDYTTLFCTYGTTLHSFVPMGLHYTVLYLGLARLGCCSDDQSFGDNLVPPWTMAIIEFECH